MDLGGSFMSLPPLDANSASHSNLSELGSARKPDPTVSLNRCLTCHILVHLLLGDAWSSLAPGATSLCSWEPVSALQLLAS